MILERRDTLEIRADGRTLIGPVVRYGEVSPTHRERFAPGSLRPAGYPVLNLSHRRMEAIAHGDDLTFTDTTDALILRATLAPIPGAEAALRGVASGRYRGFSSEFVALEESRDNGVRVVERADLRGVGLVREPSYESNRVEVRGRIGTVKASIPRGKEIDCRCADGCVRAIISGRVEVSDTAIAIRRGYAEALGSIALRTLRVGVRRDAIDVEVDLPDTSYARDLISAAENAPVLIRPIVDFAASAWKRVGRLARFTRLNVPAFVVGFTDKLKGHLPAKVSRRRRVYL